MEDDSLPAADGSAYGEVVLDDSRLAPVEAGVLEEMPCAALSSITSSNETHLSLIIQACEHSRDSTSCWSGSGTAKLCVLP